MKTIPKSKFNAGDIVWLIKDGKAVQETVFGVMYRTDSTKNAYYYRTEGNYGVSIIFPHEEAHLAATKEELIANL